MHGIPADCITTGELCDLILTNEVAKDLALIRLAKANPSIDAWYKGEDEATLELLRLGKISQEEAFLRRPREAVSRLVLEALRAGQIALYYRDAKTGERLRFDGGLFDKEFGPNEIAAGHPPMFGPHYARDLEPFLTAEAAKNFISELIGAKFQPVRRPLRSAPAREASKTALRALYSDEIPRVISQAICRSVGDYIVSRKLGNRPDIKTVRRAAKQMRAETEQGGDK